MVSKYRMTKNGLDEYFVQELHIGRFGAERWVDIFGTLDFHAAKAHLVRLRKQEEALELKTRRTVVA